MTSADPYAAFLSEQRKREVEWSSNRATKKTKIAAETPNEDLEAVKQQLAEKSAECSALQNQVDSLQRVNVSAVEAAQNKAHENFCKVSTLSNVNLHLQILLKRHYN